MAASNRTNRAVQIVLATYRRFVVTVPGDPVDLQSQELFDLQSVAIPPSGDAWLPSVNLPSCAYQVDQFVLPEGVNPRTYATPPPMALQLGWIDSQGLDACQKPAVSVLPSPVPPSSDPPKPPPPDPSCAMKTNFDFMYEIATEWVEGIVNRGSRPITILWGDHSPSELVQPGNAAVHRYQKGISAQAVHGTVREDGGCQQFFRVTIPALNGEGGVQ